MAKNHTFGLFLQIFFSFFDTTFHRERFQLGKEDYFHFGAFSQFWAGGFFWDFSKFPRVLFWVVLFGGVMLVWHPTLAWVHRQQDAGRSLVGRQPSPVSCHPAGGPLLCPRWLGSGLRGEWPAAQGRCGCRGVGWRIARDADGGLCGPGTLRVEEVAAPSPKMGRHSIYGWQQTRRFKALFSWGEGIPLSAWHAYEPALHGRESPQTLQPMWWTLWSPRVVAPPERCLRTPPPRWSRLSEA